MSSTTSSLPFVETHLTAFLSHQKSSSSSKSRREEILKATGGKPNQVTTPRSKPTRRSKRRIARRVILTSFHSRHEHRTLQENHRDHESVLRATNNTRTRVNAAANSGSVIFPRGHGNHGLSHGIENFHSHQGKQNIKSVSLQLPPKDG